MTDPTPPIQPTSPPGSKTLIYSPQVRIVVSSGGREIDVSRDVIRGRVVRAVDAVSQAEFYLNNKNGKYTGHLRRMDKVVIWMKRITWIQVFTGYLDVVPAYDLFPTEAYIRASCTLKRIKYTYWDKGLPASLLLLNPQINIDSDVGVSATQPDGSTGIIIHDLLTKVGSWPVNQVLIQQIPKKFMDFVRDNIVLVDQQEVFNRISRYIQTGGLANGAVYPWTSTTGDTPIPGGAGGKYTQSQVISMIKGVWGSTTSGVSGDKINLAAAYAMKLSGGNAKYHKDETGSGGSGRDTYGLFGLDHKAVASGRNLTIDQLYDPIANIKQAWIASGQGTNWSYWATDLGLGSPPDTLSSVAQDAPNVAAYNPSTVLNNPAVNVSGTSMEDLFSKFYGHSSGESISTVIDFAERQLNIPYGSPNPHDDSVRGHRGDGTDTPPTFDCSGLMLKAYATINLTLPHSAVGQATKLFKFQVPKSNGASWALADLQPGDLLFFPGSAPESGGDGVPNIGHVAMYVGNDNLIEAAGVKVAYSRTTPRLNGSLGFKNTANFIGRPISLLYSLNDNTGAWQNTNENGGVDPAYRLFNLLFNPQSFDMFLSGNLLGDFGPANDESLLASVSQICSASLRSFQSGPNGDFIAFFPDYFGINDTKAVWDIEDVEIIDLKVQINDDELVTHVYTIGNTTAPDSGNQSVGVADWLASSGEVSIMSKAIMDQLLAMQSNNGFLSDPKLFLQRYGLRPMTSQLSIIRSHYYEFFSSLYTFLQQWSKQFSTNVQICFMPELYPGMRMNLVNHNVCVYVESVIHTFDYQQGFQTYPTISCPSTPAGGSDGLPIALGI
jgi:cell wall-associated NlpC family hydrolase